MALKAAADYRALAAQCDEAASKALYEKTAAEFRQLAGEWRVLADRAELFAAET